MSDNDLQLRITAEDASAPAFEGVEKRTDAFSQLMLQMTREMTAEIGKVTTAVTGIGTALEKQGGTLARHAQDTKQHLTGLQEGFTKFGTTVEHAFSAEHLLGEFATGLVSIGGPLALVEVGLEGVKKALEEIYDFAKEGIVKADEVRDLTLSLGVVTGGAHQAAEAMEFFEKNADKTRSTTEELGKVLRDLAPLMSARGFSSEQQQNVTLMLSQIATMRGVSVDEMESGFRQVLAGRVSPGRNLLLQTLGITKDQVKDLGWDTLLDKMREVSSHFPEFGQSFESEMHKIRESLLVTFAEGFNEARGEAKSGMDGLRDALADPQIKTAIRDLGVLASTGLSDVTLAGTGLIAVLHDIASAAGPVGSAIANAFSWYINNANVIAWLAERGKEAQAENLSRGNTAATDAQRAFGAGLLNQMNAPLAGEDLMSFAARGGIIAGRGFKGSSQAEANDALELAIGISHEKLNPEQWKRFFSEISKAAKDGVVDLKEYQSALNLATGVKSADGTPHGKVTGDSDAAKKLEELSRAADEGIRKLDQDAAAYQRRIDELGQPKILIEHEEAFAAAENQASDAIAKIADAAEKAGMSKAAIRGLLDAFANNEPIQTSSRAVNEWAEAVRRARDAAENLADTKLMYDWSSGSGFAGMMKQSLGVDTQQIPFGRDLSSIVAMQDEMTRKQQEAQREFTQRLTHTFDVGADAFAAALEGGSHAFLDVVRRDFSGEFASAARSGLERAFEYFGGVTQGQANKGQDPTKYYYNGQAYDTAAQALGANPNAKNYQMGTMAVESGISAYGAASQQSGTRTAGVIEGAMAGSAFGLPGIIVGALAGLIGGFLGAQQRQDDYKFAKFGVSAGGYAYGYGSQNINSQEMAQYLERIQQTHDQTRDAMIRLTMTFPGYSIPGLPAGQWPQTGQNPPGMQNFMGGIPANFQDQASANFQKHLEAWISHDLPEAEMQIFKGELASDFGKIGIGVNKFNEVWDRLSKLDPSQAIQYLQQWADAWSSLNKSITFFAGEPSFQSLFGPGSHVFETEMSRLANDEHRTYGSHLAETDQGILSFAAGIHNLSLEGQIAAEQELAQKVQDRYDYEKQAIADIYNAQKQEHEAYISSKDQIAIARLMKSDGSADYYAQAQYEKTRADQELARLGAASNAGDLTGEYNKIQQFIQAAGNAGLQQATTFEDKQAWFDWMSRMFDEADRVFNARATQLGVDINNQNDAFEKQFGPILDPLRNLATSSKDVKDNFDGTREPIKQFNRDMDGAGDTAKNFGVALDGTAASATLAMNAFNGATDAVNRFADAMNAFIAGGGAGSGGQSFAARTRALR